MALPRLDLTIAGVRELSDWGDVDRLLEAMGRMDLQIAGIEAEMGEALYDLVERYAAELTAMREHRAVLENSVSAFCQARKNEFAMKRSMQLTFGRIGFRVAESIEVPKGMEDVVIATLRRLGWDECIEIKEKVDKNALKKLSDLDLARCGARRKTEDRFRVDPNLDLVADRIGATRARPAVTVDLEKLTGAIKAAPVRRLDQADRVAAKPANKPTKEKKCRSRK